MWEPGQLVSERFCAGEDENGVQTFNVVDAQLRPDVERPDTGRNVYTSSSCGICGTDSIDAVRKSSHHSPPKEDRITVPVRALAALPDRLREAQAVFDKTGGVHAAGLFRIHDDGTTELLCLREDVGSTTPWIKWWAGPCGRACCPPSRGLSFRFRAGLRLSLFRRLPWQEYPYWRL